MDPKYIDIQTIDEHMSKFMCYGLGIDKVADALMQCEPKLSVTLMYMHILLAEHNSSMAKYIHSDFYAQKEKHINDLISLCRKWRNQKSTKIVEIKLGSNSNKNKNFKNQVCKFSFFDNNDEIEFGFTDSDDKYGPKWIYYFDVPGSEQISYHTDISPKEFNGELKRYTTRWDMLPASTLMKIEYAICKRYGSVLKFMFNIDADFAYEYDSELEKHYQIRKNRKETFLVDLYIIGMKRLFEKYNISLDCEVLKFLTKTELKRQHNLTDTLIEKYFEPSDEHYIKTTSGYIKKQVFLIERVEKIMKSEEFITAYQKSLKRRKL